MMIQAVTCEPTSFYRNAEDIKRISKKSLMRDLENSVVLVAEEGCEQVGMLKIKTESSLSTRHCACLIFLYVEEKWRNKVIGKLLIENAIQGLAAEVTQIVCSTFTSNSSALNLYKNMGFKDFGLLPKARWFQDGYQGEIYLKLDRESKFSYNIQPKHNTTILSAIGDIVMRISKKIYIKR